ncbi:MAG: flagellar basal body rod protein FlgB [Nitrospinae bacterium]|nr:flagellar basal body rod protein FlgB [Nitrospinota bacterium]
MKIFGLTTKGIEIASRSLDFVADATSQAAANISNATVPGYKAATPGDFEEVMAQALKGVDEGGMAKSDPRHFPVADLNRIAPAIIEETQAQSLDGNTVNMEKEGARLGGLSLKYSAYSTIVGRELGMLKSAISLNTQG